MWQLLHVWLLISQVFNLKITNCYMTFVLCIGSSTKSIFNPSLLGPTGGIIRLDFYHHNGDKSYWKQTKMVPSRGKILPIRPISRGKIDSVDVIALPRIDTKACDIYSGQRFEMPRYINIIIEHYIWGYWRD